jgi:DNA repair photolyase
MLSIEDKRGALPLNSRYLFFRSQPDIALIRQLNKLSQSGVLRRATIYFGVSSDPFLPFNDKFDTTRKFLEIFERYRPGMLYVQTRSSLIVLLLPILQQFGKHLAVTMGVETLREDVAKRYTPEFPLVDERLRAVHALRNCGIETHLQVAPLLPYGDWKNDAGVFADLLCSYGDRIRIAAPLAGNLNVRSSSKSGITTLLSEKSRLVRDLASHRQYFWLRHDSDEPLIKSVKERAPDKLENPRRIHLEEPQLSIFAA